MWQQGLSKTRAIWQNNIRWFKRSFRHWVNELLKDKLKHIKILEFIWTKTDSNQVSPNCKQWETLCPQRLGESFYREKAKAKLGNYWCCRLKPEISQVAQWVKTCTAGDARGTGSIPGKIPWWRARQPTPVALSGEYHRQRSLGGYTPWSCKELGSTKATEHTHKHSLKPSGLSVHSYPWGINRLRFRFACLNTRASEPPQFNSLLLN